ncbi:hypothetical protein QRX60_36430 [Amycolatopsis mongoliensis]|uniref:Uncharacterized protein n=1 Tax=Amycolatopsis mongoliensis TaxID=715475 RepID=A0A9Y2JJ96_9PSEU|nr:hypothetical protein [Amycolatopsis sp. 4-36]WIX99502.1 hypothetical protein QRX60_36430 [Amycolatopsis sp. 4-36]
MKTVVRAGLVAMLATALAAPAQAATVKQVTSTCHAGEFGGTFTLRYDTSGGYHHPLGAITTAGPYIGDVGTESLRISYRDGLGTHAVYSRVSPATNGTHTETLPAGLAIPATARGTASTTFDNGTTSCVATVPIT